MRKAQKKQAENLIELLSQAHFEVQKKIEDGNDAEAMDLLIQCQEGAVKLGGFIEKAEKESREVISLLEDYCEIVYQIYESVTKVQMANVDGSCKKSCQLLDKIKSSLKNDMKTRYEIVFMPYKASMWDSLESVWQAATEDPVCDVYVVPVPYYDRNADYSLGKYHYEGGDFPNYVQITDYRSYDLKNRRPDILYIHNPYDDHNFVTSIAPQFYASKLKKYTDCLVYIPYCVYEEFDAPDQAETITFCSRYITPGLLLADRVVLQSENVRSAIINALLQYCGKNKAFWEEKILALGSPKYDKLHSSDKELPIPEDWEKLMAKPDGDRKKVIFYNTSLNSLLKYGRQMNRKIRSVLQLSYEHREECTLLWRPHPLIQAAIESMRPELLGEYKEIVDAYRAGGWGIYDETTDFHTAFAISDAYYGDYSSLLLLWQATGKPLLEQNVEIFDYRKHLAIRNIYYDGEYVWGTACEFNGLFRINPMTCQVSYMGQFPDEKPEGYMLFYGITECRGKLFFCPHNAKHIAVYDKRSAKFDMIKLKESIRDINRKFIGILLYGKYIYLQGGKACTLVQIDTETYEIVYIEKWVEELKERRGNRESSLFAKNGCVHEGSLYYICSEINCLLRIAINGFDYKFIPMPNKNKLDYRGIISANGLFWFMPRTKASISCFDLQDFILTELAIMEGGSDLCWINSYIYCFSRTELYFYRVDITSKEVTKFPIKEKIECVCAIGNKIFMMTCIPSNRWYMFDTVSQETISMDWVINENEICELDKEKLQEENQKYNQYARESGCLNLKTLIETEKIKREFGKENSCYGKRIHEYMKGLIE